MQIDDPTNLSGVSFLLNEENVDPNKKDSLKQIEEKMMGYSINNNHNKTPKDFNKQKETDKAFERLQREVGIDLNNINTSSKKQPYYSLEESDDSENSDDDESDSQEDDIGQTSKNSSFTNYGNDDSDNDDDGDDDDSDDEEDSDEENGMSFKKNKGDFTLLDDDDDDDDFHQHKKNKKHKHKYKTQGYINSLADNDERERMHVQAVMKNISSSHAEELYSLDKEEELELKHDILENIDEMREFLEDNDVDTSKIPEVDEDHSIIEMRRVEKLLKRKFVRRKYSTFANQWIMMGVYGLEGLFNGKKKYFGYSPDLTDIHNEIHVKLRQSKHETSSFIANLAKRYNIGPGWMFFLDMIPYVMNYSKKRKDRATNITYNPSAEDMADAYDMLDDMETGY